MTGRHVGLFATIAALVLLVPLAVYLPWVLIGLALAAGVAGPVRRGLFRTHTQGGFHF